MRRALVIIGLLLAMFALLLPFRFPIAVFFFSLGPPPTLSPPGALGAGEYWFDDYYTVTEIDDRTFAIAEPRHPGQVYNYLILGDDGAILFDSGLPLRDISPVVSSLTDAPLTVIASHLHYDHVGNHERLDRIAMPDTPEIRARLDDGWFEPTRDQHMGYVEGHSLPRWKVSELIPHGRKLELGGRTIQVLHTPGHTSESVSLWDAQRELLFTGDYIYEGALWAFLPNSSLPDYLTTAEALLDLISTRTRILTAHRSTPPGLPVLGHQDLVDLRNLLISMREGEAEYEGLLPAKYRINERLSLETDVPWFHDWN